MRSSTRSAVLICVLLAACLSGCGLIGGPFSLPEDEVLEPSGTEIGGGMQTGSGQAAPTPLPLQVVTPLPTGIPHLPPDCMDALAVTMDDYGKQMCVGGIVTRITMEGGTYRVFFGPRGTLYMLGPGWEDRIGLRAGECAYAEGKLSRDGVAPVMPITPYTLKRCPVA
jgi:predicted small lipoprotein YifL